MGQVDTVSTRVTNSGGNRFNCFSCDRDVCLDCANKATLVTMGR